MASSSRNASSRWIFDILKVIANAPAPPTTMEISSTLGLPPTTAHRGVKTLQQAGYVVQIEGAAGLVLTAATRRLSQAFLSRFAIRGVSLQYIRKLANTSEETATLAVPLGNYSLRIAAVLGTNEGAVRAPIGQSTELHKSASGIAMLSSFEEERICEYIIWAVKKHGANATMLRKRLVEASRLGYSLSSHGTGEITDLAVPVRDVSGAAIAAIAVRGLSLNNRGSLKKVIAANMETASIIEGVVQENPDAFLDPYRHLAWQDIALPLLTVAR